MEDRCIMCGAIVPEGYGVCYNCKLDVVRKCITVKDIEALCCANCSKSRNGKWCSNSYVSCVWKARIIEVMKEYNT